VIVSTFGRRSPSANSIELAVLLLRSLAFTCQLLPHLRGFSICAVRFRAAPVQKAHNARSTVSISVVSILSPKMWANADDELK
jgi:hypothetical protein